MEMNNESSDSDDKIRKTSEIITQEFAREIIEKENEVFQIQEKILQTQRYMKILKYVAAYSYYQGDEASVSENKDELLETGIHPCVQKLLPGRKDLKAEPSDSSCDNDIKPIMDFSDDAQESKFEPRDVTMVRGSYKIRHCLVVGNVSKWIPPVYREDQATHKWMLYLRDKKRDEDLGSLIKKVRYFLHESYKPHDIIEVTSSPFHLTRRGWGQFPVRVKIFFTHPDNKPIDFIHQLRLDDTFSGTQTLGGETVVEVDLFHDNIDDLIPKEVEEDEAPPKRVRSRLEEIIDAEHDYCLKTGTDPINLDSRPVFQPQQIVSTCDVGDSSEMAIIQNWCPSDDSSSAEWYRRNILKRAESIYFLSSEACVKWFLQRWPIVTGYAANPLYKMFHPYAFPSVSSFALSNIGKQRAAEWFRAFKISQMMKDLRINTWTPKQIMMYSRMHGYVLVFGSQFNYCSSKKFRNISTYTSQVDTFRDLRQLEISPDLEIIDVVNFSDAKEQTPTPVKCSQRIRAISTWISFVEDSTKELGIKFKDEEVLPGKITNASIQILAKILKRFLNDLLRKSLANAWIRNSCKNPASLELEDLIKTIVENPEFDIFTNSGLGAKSSII